MVNLLLMSLILLSAFLVPLLIGISGYTSARRSSVVIAQITENEEQNQKIYEQASDILKRGGLVAFPTETVYGLGADALDEEAAKKTYAAKGRPSDNPLIVHIARLEDLGAIVESVPLIVDEIAAHFWPGPLTMIFNKNEKVPLGTTGGLETVAVRMPDDEIARIMGYTESAIERIRDAEISQDEGFVDDDGEGQNEEDNTGAIGGYDFG